MTTIRLYLHMMVSMLMIFSYSAVYSSSMQIDPMPKSPTITYEEIDIEYARSLPIQVDEEIVQIQVKPTPRYGFTEDDIYLLAQLLCGDESIDGDGEYDFVWNLEHDKPYLEEMGKVLNVVMNRQRSGKYPEKVRDIVLQPSQFSPMPENLDTIPSDLAIEAVREWCSNYDTYTDVQIIPEDHLYFTAGPGLTNVTRKDW